MSDAIQRFIDQLQEDAQNAHRAAEVWLELKRNTARIEDPDGRLITAAEQMEGHFREREKEYRNMIAKLESKEPA